MYFGENVLARIFHSHAEDRPFSLVSEGKYSNRQQRLAQAKWMLDGKHRIINQSIWSGYQAGKMQDNWFSNLLVNKTEMACGLTVVFGRDLKGNEVDYYFDYLRNRLLETGYQLQHSYREMSDQTLHVESTDKYFFRHPNEGSRRKKVEALKGTVTLEYICIDNTPSHGKWILMTNGDKKYNPEKEFEHLLGTVFEF